MFQLVSRRALSDEVFEQVRDQILTGKLQANDRLPSERSLCEMLGVNRGVIREALKRLEQAQLIRVQHGGGTTVLDYKLSGSMELLPALLLQGDEPNLEVVRCVMELRLALGRDIARLCALRAKPPTLAAIEEVTASMLKPDNWDELEGLSGRFWELLVEGSENIAYQLAFNALRRTFEQLRSVFRERLSKEWENAAHYRKQYEALSSGNADEAVGLIEELLQSAM